jgi:hypothetical protein
VKALNPWVEVLPSGFRKTFSVFFEHFPVVTGRGTPRGHRGPFHAEPASFAALQGYGAAGRSLRPPVSSPARLHRPLRLRRRPRRLVRPPVSSPARLRRPSRLRRRPRRLLRPLGVEPGSALSPVFTTSRSSRLRTVYTASRLRFSFPSLPRCGAWKELQRTS